MDRFLASLFRCSFRGESKGIREIEMTFLLVHYQLPFLPKHFERKVHWSEDEKRDGMTSLPTLKARIACSSSNMSKNPCPFTNCPQVRLIKFLYVWESEFSLVTLYWASRRQQIAQAGRDWEQGTTRKGIREDKCDHSHFRIWALSIHHPRHIGFHLTLTVAVPRHTHASLPVTSPMTTFEEWFYSAHSLYWFPTLELCRL